MEMMIQTQRQIILKVIDDHEEGLYEVDTFLSSLLKMKKIINKVGFMNKFSREEKAIWNSFFEKYDIMDTEQQNTQNIQNVNNLQEV